MGFLFKNVGIRLIGLAAVILGYFIFGLGLDVPANRPGGSDSDY
jgi:hypothetical protein